MLIIVINVIYIYLLGNTSILMLDDSHLEMSLNRVWISLKGQVKELLSVLKASIGSLPSQTCPLQIPVCTCATTGRWNTC